MRRTFLLLLLICAALLAHPALDAFRLYRQSIQGNLSAYPLVDKRLTDRVVLVIVDSWALRIIESPDWMPRLHARQSQGASGILWAPMQTGTMEGILTLSTGTPPGGLSAIGLMSSSRYRGWTIFDDVAARKEGISFAGGPAWVTLFGNRGTDNQPENGHGPMYRRDDVAGLEHLENALLSSNPPALSVLHISETDFAAHQFGTTGSAYAEVMRFWDESLDHFLSRVLVPGTTVILTADHGNDLNGSHGGSGAIYRRVPVLMWGTGILPGARFEMNASDMPATIAVLLGVRAPGSAIALPAVEAMDLTTEQRATILKAAYTQAVLKNPRVLANTALQEKAHSTLDQFTTDSSSGRSSGGTQPPAPHISRLRMSVTELEPQLAALRSWDPLDWIFAALTFGAALILGRLSWSQNSNRSQIRVRQAAGWTIAFVLVEAAFCVRYVMSGAIKLVLRNRAPSTIAALICLVLLAAAASWIAWTRRKKLVQWMKANAMQCAVLLYLLSTVLHPVTTLGLIGIVMVGAMVYSSAWPLRLRLWVVAVIAIYLILGSLVLWPLLGEKITARYAVGVPVAILGTIMLILLERKYRESASDIRSVGLAGVVLLLALFPAGGLGLAGWSSANLVPLASALLALFCYAVAAVVGRPPWWVWLAPVSVLGFWWFPTSAILNLSLVSCAVLLLAGLWKQRFLHSHRVGLFLLLACMLLLLTEPTKAVSLFLLLSAVLAFLVWEPRLDQRTGAIVFAALFVMGCRYAIFDLFGNSDDMLFFSLQSIDIRSAYVGDSTRAIVPAVLIALLKVCLAGSVLLAALPLFVHWRRWYGTVAGLAGMFLIINIGQATIYAGLMFGDRTYLYDGAVFSILIGTGLFVFAALSFCLLAAFTREQREVSILSSDLQCDRETV